MSTLDQKVSSQILTDCQAKLVEIDRQISQLKGRYRAGKSKHKYRLHTDDDFIILKKEADTLERDIQFVKTLIEDASEIESSFPMRCMKKVFPTKIFSSHKPVSNDIKTKIIAHSTALLEEKVKVLQTVAKSKKKKRKSKPPESIDSMVTDSSNSINPSRKYRAGASSDSEIVMNSEKVPSLKVYSSLKKQHDLSTASKNKSFITPADLQIWNSELSKYFTSNNKIPSYPVAKTNDQRNYHYITYCEQHVQTTEVNRPFMKVSEKYVQTDLPLVTWATSILNHFKVSKKYVDKETNTDSHVATRSPPDKINTNVKLIQGAAHQNIISSLPNNILNINEIDSIISSMLSNPLKMLQCKHFGKSNSPGGYVNLIVRQCDFRPSLVSTIEQKTITLCKTFLPKENTFLAHIYNVKQNTYWATFKRREGGIISTEEIKSDDTSTDQSSSVNYCNVLEQTEYSVQYKKNVDADKKTCKARNTLQIDYKNPLTSGRIVLTEFENTHSSSQSEMLSRILTHLIGLPSSNKL